jgi:pimeloyl-ACP methyl ester carboxylesterase
MVRTDLFETRDHTIHLHDGRTLGYAEYGVPEGKALFYFGASRLEARFLAEQATQARVRLLGIDRPGMGLSDFQAGRQLLGWPSDVVESANCLQLDRFAVVGVSGGGPYMLACASNIPDRLTACGVISGEGPLALVADSHVWDHGTLLCRASAVLKSFAATPARINHYFSGSRCTSCLSNGKDSFIYGVISILMQETPGSARLTSTEILPQSYPSPLGACVANTARNSSITGLPVFSCRSNVTR